MRRRRVGRRGHAHAAASLALAALGVCSPGAAADAPRVTGLYRCGDLLDSVRFEFCVDFSGGRPEDLRLMLGGRLLDAATGAGEQIRFEIDRSKHSSGPLCLEQAGVRSNSVWLSVQDSAIVAAGPAEVAKNSDGIDTYVDLVSIIVEEEFDALAEARRLAGKYGASVVGSIPPLRVYQLRLSVPDLVHRDALVLRLGGEESVDTVVIEESSAEDAETARQQEPRRPDSEVAANRFVDAVDYYRRRVPGPPDARVEPAPQRLGVIERALDFDAPDFFGLIEPKPGEIHLFGRDAASPRHHGSTIAGILAAGWDDGGNTGFLRALDGHHNGIDIIVDRGSDAGIAENVAASVRLVQDGARVLNWSWGVHRVGAIRVGGGDIGSAVRSGVAFEGYEELFEEFFLWLRRHHPEVVVVNSAGNASSFSGSDDYRLPSSFVTPQLIVVGAHQRSGEDVPVGHPDYAEQRGTSNIDARVDITAAACVAGSVAAQDDVAELHCGTSYATALVSGLVTAMLTINTELMPDEIRELLRRASMPIGTELDFEPAEAEDLTAPILPSERAEQLDHPDVGRSARLDMRQALLLTVESLHTVE
ncbi:MAG: S8/S53 family peptidase [Woeseia sp.]